MLSCKYAASSLVLCLHCSQCHPSCRKDGSTDKFERTSSTNNSVVNFSSSQLTRFHSGWSYIDVHLCLLLVKIGLQLYINLVLFSFRVAQLLVHRVLFRLFPPLESTSSQKIPLEKLSFENLKSYLDKNPDCSRCVVLLSLIISFHIFKK